MCTFSWNPAYSVKISRLDEHHKHLLSLIHGLHEAIANQVGSAAVQPLLDELAEYATYHFAAEESLMEKANFPGINAHREEHRWFVRRLAEIQQDVLEIGGQTLATAIFLYDWLVEHMTGTDQQYVLHLTRHGCS